MQKKLQILFLLKLSNFFRFKFWQPLSKGGTRWRESYKIGYSVCRAWLYFCPLPLPFDKFEFYMKKRPSKIFLVIAISSLFLLVPDYHNSPNLSEIDLFSTDLNLEIDDLFDVKNHESNTFLSIIFPIEFLPGVNRFEQAYHLRSQIPSFDQNISILRC